MRILVFGAGAVGSVLGGFLAKGGHEVTLLGRAWHLEAVRRQGLDITGLWGTHHVDRLATATAPEEVPRRDGFDWVFVCVKAYQTASAADTLGEFLGPRTLVCAFQNGLGNYDILSQRVSPERVALGRVIFGVELSPGRAQVTVCADDVLIGAPDPRVPSARMAELALALDAAGIPTRATTDILTAVWAKALYNCALNGLSTLLEVPYGRLPEHPAARRMMDAVIEEAYRAAWAHRIRLEPSEAQAYLELLFTRLIPPTATHQSSMLQDIRRGKPTEIDALNGALVRLARQAGLSAPANELITRLVHAKERFAGVSGIAQDPGVQG